MSDNEILLAISNMIEPLRNDVQGIRQDIKGIRQDIGTIENRIKNIELVQENQILPRLNTIEACYTSIFDRYKDSIEDYETMKLDISIVKNVVTEHSEKLQKLA